MPRPPPGPQPPAAQQPLLWLLPREPEEPPQRLGGPPPARWGTAPTSMGTMQARRPRTHPATRFRASAPWWQASLQLGALPCMHASEGLPVRPCSAQPVCLPLLPPGRAVTMYKFLRDPRCLHPSLRLHLFSHGACPPRSATNRPRSHAFILGGLALRGSCADHALCASVSPPVRSGGCVAVDSEAAQRGGGHRRGGRAGQPPERHDRWRGGWAAATHLLATGRRAAGA
jgi:hypothetical protein